MKNLITNFKNCIGILIVCAFVAFFQGMISGSIESSTKKGAGLCEVGRLALAGDRALKLSNDLQKNSLVVELTCNGDAVVTAQSDVILATSVSHLEQLQCIWHANNVAKCEVPASAEAAK